MKATRIILISGFFMGVLLCAWIFRKPIPNETIPKQTLLTQSVSTQGTYYIEEPYHGIQIESGEISSVEQSARNGSAKDAIRLALHYGIAQHDMTRGIEYYKVAANLGSPDAAYNLGQIYSSEPEFIDVDQAEHWYAVAAERDNTNAVQILKRFRSIPVRKAASRTNL